MSCLCVYVCVFFYCLCLRLCPVLTYSHCVLCASIGHFVSINWNAKLKWLPLNPKYVLTRSLLSPHSYFSWVWYLLRSFQSSVVLPLVSFTLINCPTKALPNWGGIKCVCPICHGILSLNSNLLVAKQSLKTVVNQSFLLMVISNLVLFSNLLDLLVLRPLLPLCLVVLVLLPLDPSFHNPVL